ncbi:hypothetical protein ACJRO7_004254 [Eucalyptus globulus]|uniref:C2H2-type domain-containing protein n=1 Tax=Eucalyptus globulus TaxID=34317 RepID=A0ABD3IYY2_EUCGL
MLGGHMRCHMDMNLPEREPPLVIDNSSADERRLGYYLRENPKKTWKFSKLKESAQEKSCPVCDERFTSMRALFCHRKIHSGKDDESGDWCKGRGKGSRSMKFCQDHTRPIHDRERLNLSLLNEDHFVGSSKTKSDLLLIVLSDDETMRLTRRKRTPRIEYDVDERTEGIMNDVDERTEGIMLSAPNGSSYSSKAELDPGTVGAISLMMLSQGETDFNSPGLGVKPFGKSLTPDIFDVEKEKAGVTETSECNESHSSGYLRREQKGVEMEVPTGILCGAREVGLKKARVARSGKDAMYEAATMDGNVMGGSGSRERAELWIELRLNSYKDKVCAEESQVVGELVEKNNAESYKQEAPVDASQGIEGSSGCTELKSINDDSGKLNRQVCSTSCVRSDNGAAPNIGV